MTSSPNHNNPYAKFDEWSAWNNNDVDQKVAILKATIDNLKASNASKGDCQKGMKGNTREMAAL
jgi:hypothetical protein